MKRLQQTNNFRSCITSVVKCTCCAGQGNFVTKTPGKNLFVDCMVLFFVTTVYYCTNLIESFNAR